MHRALADATATRRIWVKAVSVYHGVGVDHGAGRGVLTGVHLPTRKPGEVRGTPNSWSKQLIRDVSGHVTAETAERAFARLFESDAAGARGGPGSMPAASAAPSVAGDRDRKAVILTTPRGGLDLAAASSIKRMDGVGKATRNLLFAAGIKTVGHIAEQYHAVGQVALASPRDVPSGGKSYRDRRLAKKTACEKAFKDFLRGIGLDRRGVHLNEITAQARRAARGMGLI